MVTGGVVGLWRALRLNPTHAPETGLLHVLPQLTPQVVKWQAKLAARQDPRSPDRQARRVVWRSAGVARRGGLITGSSFYVGMLPAMAMIYCEQLVMVLRIAAAYGKDPADPRRAAEILVIQGRYTTVNEAAQALHAVATSLDSRHTAPELRTIVSVARQVPSMIGLTVRRFRSRSFVDRIVVGAEVASYFAPIISLPVWAYANARAMRRLGRSAVAFYSGPGDDADDVPPITFAPRPKPRVRRLVIATVLPIALALGLALSYIPVVGYTSGLRWVALAIGETAVVLIFARLTRLTSAAAA